jgi:tetratricopeptide (TPR) repeat protein
VVAIASLPLTGTRDDLLEHHVSMKLSRCYRASNGKLGCLTCHDPHEQPEAAAAPAYFRQRCLTCHQDTSCRISLEIRQKNSPANDCIGCHMPKRDVRQISHSALTNHRIVRGTNEPIPLDLPESVTGDLPELLLLNKQIQQRALPDVTKLTIYGQLLSRQPNLQSHYLELLDRLSHTTPDDPLVLAALGRKAALEMSAQATDYLAKAIQSGLVSQETFADWGRALAQNDKPEESAAAFQAGIKLFPYSQELRKYLILSYIKQKQFASAGEALAQYVADFPEDDFMRKLLLQASSQKPAN